MAAEHFSAPFISRLSLPCLPIAQQGYYRSKLFIAPFSTNPLVAAAGPLLSLLERLCIASFLPPITSIRDNIEHELRAFRSRLHGKHASEELHVIAHYLLCATIDELLGKNYIRLHGKIAEFIAFTPSSYNENVTPQDSFFDIVDYVKERPNQYLDLIELSYYCLITGFEGKHHGQASGRLVLDNLIEELYQLIQQYRVNKPVVLFEAHESVNLTPTKRPSLLTIGLVSLGILLVGYFTSYCLLTNQVKAVQNGHTIISTISKLDY